MPQPFACPHCQLETLVDDALCGLSGPCAGCGKTITVPRPAMPLLTVERTTPAAGSSWRSIAIVVTSGIAAALLLFCTVLWFVFPALGGIANSVRSISCRSNLERIAAALKQYEIDHGTLPPAYVTDSSGRRMHSWRVLILPQLGEQGLHDQYRFDEPWNGPNNSQLIKRMPATFGCPADPDAALKGESSYMVLVGPGTLFPGSQAMASGRAQDDRSSTILVAETPVAGVAWTEPRDLDATRMKFSIYGAMSGEIGSLHSGGAHVVAIDGKARFISELFPDEYLQAMSTASGGEDVPLELLE